MGSFDYLPLSLQLQVLQLLLPILAAIAADSHTTVDESHSRVHILMVDVLALGSRCWRWVRGGGVGRESRAEFVSPWSTCWHWVDVSTLGLNSDMLASGSSSRRWRWVRGIGIGFYISSLSSCRGSALDLLEPALLVWNPRH